jgi:transketolase C-terminal domain/subunit/NADH dehydrogenase FAD-containing subunit
MPASDTFVIVGGGLAGAKAAEALRAQGFDDRIVLAAEEDTRPYERPPLSKEYLQGKAERDTIFVHAPDWYDANGIELLPGTAVTAIDRGRREVTLSGGGHLAYGKLLLATGSVPRRLPLPGADADGVLYLRRVADSDRIRDTFTTASRVLIIGAGWIGLEVAAAVRTAGVDVTIMEMADLPLLHVLGPQAAPVFAGLHWEQGVDLRLGVRVGEITVSGGKATGARLADGTRIGADAVIVGIGAAQRAVAVLGGERNLHVTSPRPDHHDIRRRPEAAAVTLPRYQVSSRVATRKAYGDALVALGARPEVVALDGEVGNSTYAGEFAAAHPDRFFEMFIAEQQLIAAAVGPAVRGYVPFVSTFAAFFTCGYDFLRMAGISGANIKLCGSHAGAEIGPDGPSQMALEDLAALRVIHGSTVLYPADATAAAALTAEMVDTPGIVYLRTTQGAWPVLYPAGEAFPVGGSKVLRAGPGDEVTLIGAGVTVHQCLRAADELAADGSAARIIDLYSGQARRLGHPGGCGRGDRWAAGQRGGPLPPGRPGCRGARGAGRYRPAAAGPAVRGQRPAWLRHPDELMEAAGISSSRIAAAARELLKD